MPVTDDLGEYQRLMRLSREGHRIGAELNQLRQTLRRRYNHFTVEDAIWVLDQLSNDSLDSDTTCFIATLLEFAHGLPETFFPPLIRAAVYETNPSLNRYFVEPAVREFGTERVAEQLLQMLKSGTNFEKGGAANAIYWVRAGSGRDTAPLSDIWQRIRDQLLAEFASNDDTQVRRCIIAKLSMKERDYSPGVRDLINVAIEIARNHPDDYIRHRIEVQLGNESLLRLLPDRTR